MYPFVFQQETHVSCTCLIAIALLLSEELGSYPHQFRNLHGCNATDFHRRWGPSFHPGSFLLGETPRQEPTGFLFWKRVVCLGIPTFHPGWWENNVKIRHFSLPSGSKTRGVGVFDPQVDFRFLDSCLSFGVDHRWFQWESREWLNTSRMLDVYLPTFGSFVW